MATPRSKSKKTVKTSNLKRAYSMPLWQVVVFVVAFAGLGTYTLTNSFAANGKGGGGGGKPASATLQVQVVASVKSPGYALMHITGCGYSASSYVTQFNYKFMDAPSGWASFGSLPVGADGCIDYQDADDGVVLRKFEPGNYSAYITQKTFTSKANTVASSTFVVGANGLTQ